MQKMIGLKKKLASGALTIGSWITLAHPAIAEIMAGTGFDWLVVDLEHSVITIREAEELIRVITLCGVPALVRLTANDANQIKRVMDAGASGIIVPMVNSVEEAEQAVAALYYPTLGKRGVGLARAQGYGTQFKGYVEWLSMEATLIVQIEHIDAVKNIEAILSVHGIDGYIIGPYDLSGSLGVPGQFDHSSVLETIAHVKAVAKQTKKPGGIHVIEPDPQALRKCFAEGFNFLAYSLDTRMLDVMCRQGLKEFR